MSPYILSTINESLYIEHLHVDSKLNLYYPTSIEEKILQLTVMFVFQQCNTGTPAVPVLNATLVPQLYQSLMQQLYQSLMQHWYPSCTSLNSFAGNSAILCHSYMY